MVKLSKTVMIWPHPVDLLRGGHKLIQTRTYAEIATSIGSPYPLLTTIHDVNDLDCLRSKDVIIKRAYSECGEHVLFGNSADADLKAKLQREMEITRKHWSSLPPHRQPVWLMEPLLPTMDEKCEVRCFFVGMKWLYSVVTGKGSEKLDESGKKPDEDGEDGEVMEASQFYGALPLTNIAYVICRFPWVI
jgi:hypothetical protein